MGINFDIIETIEEMPIERWPKKDWNAMNARGLTTRSALEETRMRKTPLDVE